MYFGMTSEQPELRNNGISELLGNI